jgi:hypothetical protein
VSNPVHWQVLGFNIGAMASEASEMTEVPRGTDKHVTLPCNTQDMQAQVEMLQRGCVTADTLAKLMRVGNVHYPSKDPNRIFTDSVIQHVLSLGKTAALGILVLRRIVVRKQGEGLRWCNPVFVLTPVELVEKDGIQHLKFPKTIINTTTLWSDAYIKEINGNTHPLNAIFFVPLNEETFCAAKLINLVGTCIQETKNGKSFRVDSKYKPEYLEGAYDFLNFFNKKESKGHFGNNATKTTIVAWEQGKKEKLEYFIPMGAIFTGRDKLDFLMKGSIHLQLLTESWSLPLSYASLLENSTKARDLIQTYLEEKRETAVKSKKKLASRPAEDADEGHVQGAFTMSSVYDIPFDSSFELDVEENKWVGVNTIANRYAKDLYPLRPDGTKSGRMVDVQFPEHPVFWYMGKLSDGTKHLLKKEAQVFVQKAFVQLLRTKSLHVTANEKLVEGLQIIYEDDNGNELDQPAQQNVRKTIAVLLTEANNIGRNATLFGAMCLENAEYILKKTVENYFSDTGNASCKGLVQLYIKWTQVFNQQEQERLKKEPPTGFFFNLLHRFLREIIEASKIETELILARNHKVKIFDEGKKFPQASTLSVKLGEEIPMTDEWFDLLSPVCYRATRYFTPLRVKGQHILVAQLWDENGDEQKIIVRRQVFPYSPICKDDPTLLLQECPHVTYQEGTWHAMVITFIAEKTQRMEAVFTPLIPYMALTATQILYIFFWNRVRDHVKLPDELMALLHEWDEKNTEAPSKDEFKTRLNDLLSSIGRLQVVKNLIACKDSVVRGIIYTGLFPVRMLDEDRKNEYYHNLRLNPFEIEYKEGSKRTVRGRGQGLNLGPGRAHISIADARGSVSG